MSSVLVKSLKSSKHCVENVSIRSFLVPILPHSDRISLRIQSECGREYGLDEYGYLSLSVVFSVFMWYRNITLVC